MNEKDISSSCINYNIRKIMREKGFYERQIYLEIEKEPWSERKKNEMQKDNRGKKENGRESYMRCYIN